MRRWFPSRWICAAVLALSVFALLPKPIAASHSWGPYHWARASAAIKNIPVRRLHSAGWVTRYNTAMTDWRKPAMTKIKPFTAATGGPSAACTAPTGQVSSCDASYGNTGWLGLATIWISGSHIVRGNSKVNNTYFNQAFYNTIPWRQLVICQEIGHNFGLGHVNVVFGNRNVGSCMDYTNDPDGGGAYGPSNMHPYAHDYALINSKHNHIGFDIPGQIAEGMEAEEEAAPRETEMPRAMEAYNPVVLSQFGTLKQKGDGGRTAVYEIQFASGWKAVNFVTWANATDGR